ncbi:uncharacterized protein LOC116290487 isoform X2 [Actinia tenebrosa]|uniref:Uncharacterized protein LOC116290487 isoform X2 n=1 Tax=Actinia tenebrosa TaxID=6105 RepID=A0A6P8HAC5_ACTTE|nr:uncharacterized protein LOC116290487 isoform X2 [Actinia tenebrosa]
MTKTDQATKFILFLLLFYVAFAQEKDCKDVLAVCKHFLRLREGLGLTKTQACSEVWPRRYCKETCGLCKKVTKCDNTQYGCCWDNVTPRSKTGECPVILETCLKSYHRCGNLL